MRPPVQPPQVTNRACPVGEGLIRNVVVVSRRVLPRGEDPSFDQAWARYKQGDAAYRDKRMKYLPRLKSAAPCRRGSLAPWLLSSAIYLMGGQRPVKMGTGYLRQQHSTTADSRSRSMQCLHEVERTNCWSQSVRVFFKD